MRTKDKLTKPKRDKGGMADGGRRWKPWRKPQPSETTSHSHSCFSSTWPPWPPPRRKAQYHSGLYNWEWVAIVDSPHPLRSQWSHRKTRRYGWRYTIDGPNGGGWTNPNSWTNTAIKTMAFNTPDCYNAAIKPTLDNSVSTHSFQPKDIPDPNSKRMGTGSEVPWRISRSGIEEAKGAQETPVSW